MRITFPSATTAELVHPDGAPRMGLVVIPDVMGLRPLFDEHCARLAREHSWSVCAFELYPGREHLGREERLAAAAELRDDRILDDALAAAEATGCDTVGIVGFCMGGMYACKSVATGRFARAVAFYGMIRVPEAWRGPGQGEPLDAVMEGDAGSLLAIIGTEDPFTPPDDVGELVALGVHVVRYEGADHGFAHDPDRPAHRREDAADAWARALAWLAAAEPAQGTGHAG